MKFGPTPLDHAEGALLAHAWKGERRSLKKGHRLTADDVQQMREFGLRDVIAATLDVTDVHEDEAATRIAGMMTSGGMTGLIARDAFTGRVNLHAEHDGLVVIDQARIDAANAIHESLTLATLPHGDTAERGQMIATIKIIPFAVDAQALDTFMTCLSGDQPVLGVYPWHPYTVHLIQTTLPATPGKMLRKTRRITDQRLAESRGEIISEQHCVHETDALAQALAGLPDDESLIMVFGASAITDRRDVVPSAIEQAGGRVDHLGMPVDPGNLLLLGQLHHRQVIGIPGCARSPKLNGFDFVLRRHAAGLTTRSADIMAMGVGGLLAEIPLRAQPRDPTPTVSLEPIAVVILAAGMSRRMGELNKLILPISGQPMIRHVISRYLEAGLSNIHVVTGHQPEMIREALDGLDVTFVHNADYASGQASSLRCGMASLPDSSQACLVGLGDTPELSARAIRDVLQAYKPDDQQTLVVRMHGDHPAHPVLFDQSHFASLTTCQGDQGAGHYIRSQPAGLHVIQLADAAASADLDTMDDYHRWLSAS